jgi:hypothetical protein
MKRLVVAVMALLLGLETVWLLNYILLNRPVQGALAADSRNASFELRAHYECYVTPTTLVLDLIKVESAAPIDLFRGLFQSAQALEERGRSFERVVLARAGRPVFFMKGSDYLEVGRAFRAGENPVYLIRTLPEKLFSPNGTAAFGTWTGGWLGVLGRQMEDANEAGSSWALGRRPP